MLFNLIMTIFMLLFGGLMALATYTSYQTCKIYTQAAKEIPNMTATTTAIVSKVDSVRRRNRSFRWTNYIPTFQYEINGTTYFYYASILENMNLKYDIGDTAELRYDPANPESALIVGTEKKIGFSSKMYIFCVGLLGLLSFNLLWGAINSAFATITSLFV